MYDTCAADGGCCIIEQARHARAVGPEASRDQRDRGIPIPMAWVGVGRRASCACRVPCISIPNVVDKKSIFLSTSCGGRAKGMR